MDENYEVDITDAGASQTVSVEASFCIFVALSTRIKVM